MSRKQSRARTRRAWMEQLRDRVEAARAKGPGALEKLLRWLKKTGWCVWDAARAVADHHPFDPDENAMAAQIVDERLAGCMRGMIERRENTVWKPRRTNGK